MIKQTVYANALLSDGKLLFWYTGRNKCDKYSFYKDFYYSGMKADEYFKSHKMECRSTEFSYECSEEFDEKDIQMNKFCFDVLAKDFYRMFEISPDSKGSKPY